MLQIKVGNRLASLRLPFRQALVKTKELGAEAVEIDENISVAKAEPGTLPLVHEGGPRGLDAAAEQADQHALARRPAAGRFPQHPLQHLGHAVWRNVLHVPPVAEDSARGPRLAFAGEPPENDLALLLAQCTI